MGRTTSALPQTVGDFDPVMGEVVSYKFISPGQQAKESLPEWVVVYASFSFLLCPRVGPVQSPCFFHLPFPSSILSFLICWRRQNPPGLGAGWSSGLWVAGGLRALPFTEQCFDS